MTKTMTFSTLAALLACTACGGGPVDLGENKPAKTGEKLGDYAASWDGYVEAYLFESGTDRVRLTLDENGNGYVLLGDVPELPPATDPEVGYPPQAVDPLDVQSAPSGFVEGFRYPAHAARAQERRLQLGLFQPDLFADWCAMQTPLLDTNDTDEPSYSCVANVGFSFGANGCALSFDTGPVPVDCGKLMLCLNVCQCTAESCNTWPPADANDLSSYSLFDGALDDGGSSLVGSLRLEDDLVTVRLTRTN